MVTFWSRICQWSRNQGMNPRVRLLRNCQNFVILIKGFLVLHDVIKWIHFPRNWPFVRGIHRPPVNSPHKSQWRGALLFSLICTRINGWVDNGEAGDLRCHRAHYDVTLMKNPVSCTYGYLCYTAWLAFSEAMLLIACLNCRQGH